MSPGGASPAAFGPSPRSCTLAPTRSYRGFMPTSPRVRVVVACLALGLAACDRPEPAPKPSEAKSSEPKPSDPPAAPAAPSAPVVEGLVFPIGAVVYAHEQRRVFRGVTSDLTWVATHEDAVGLLTWMSESTSSLGDVVIDVHGPSDPGVPQTGLPSGMGAAISVTRAQSSERCLPCYDAFGTRVAEPIEGCDCP